MKKTFLVLFGFCFFGVSSFAQSRPPKNYRPPRVTSSQESALHYDLSAGTGRYNDASYSEITAGLNWQVSDWWVWRNAVFHRFGTDENSVTGLDTSLRVGNSFVTESGGLGLDFFAGPGYRFASSDAAAFFGEAGLGFRLGGIYLGVGLKSLYYTQTRVDSRGRDLSKNDNQLFIILGGGGYL